MQGVTFHLTLAENEGLMRIIRVVGRLEEKKTAEIRSFGISLFTRYSWDNKMKD